MRLTDANNPVDTLSNNCPIIAGYGVEKTVALEDFTKPKKVSLKVKKGKPEVFEDGKKVRMKLGHEYTTPDGYSTFEQGKYLNNGEYLANTLAVSSCNTIGIGLGIGGAVFPDGTMAGHFNGIVYRATARNLAVAGVEQVVAAWDFTTGSLEDISSNGHTAAIVGKASLIEK